MSLPAKPASFQSRSGLSSYGSPSNSSPLVEAVDSPETWVERIRLIVREEIEAASINDRPEWLTTEQAANLLQICSTSLEKARSMGRGPLASIPHAKIGRSVRYARADITAVITRLRVPGRVTKA